jgi:hypothetical protein
MSTVQIYIYLFCAGFPLHAGLVASSAMTVTMPRARSPVSSSAQLEALQRLCRSGAGSPAAGMSQPIVSSGLPALDRLLPHGGLRLGSLLEWLEPEATDGVATAAGATSYALAVGVRLQAAVGLPAGRSLVVIDREGRFYPPAILPWLDSAQPAGQEPTRTNSARTNSARTNSARTNSARTNSARTNSARTKSTHAGSTRTEPAREVSEERRYRQYRHQHHEGAQRLYVIRPSNEADEIWAIDQSLRCSGVAAVIGWPGRVSSTVLRRWQLAARSSGVVGLFVRPAAARHEPTWAEARIQVCPSRRLSSAADSSVSARPLASWSDERACRLILVGGRWDAAATVAEPAVECVLDLASGRQRRTESVAAGQARWRRATCRAS